MWLLGETGRGAACGFSSVRYDFFPFPRMFALRGEKAKAFNKSLKGFLVETKAKELQVFLSC